MEAATLRTIETERVAFGAAVERMDFRQGEHVTLIGPTGRGKTELTVKLLKAFDTWTVFFGTKKKDTTQDLLKAMGYRTVENADALNPDIARRFIIRPKFPRRTNDSDQIKRLHRKVFEQALLRAFDQTGWLIAMDEARYICHFLGLSETAQLIWLQGRSQGNTIICNTQRSRFIPLEAYDQATHLFMWTDPDLSNVARNSELAGFNKNAALIAMQEMSKHDVLYVNTATGDMFITNTRWETT
jgi:energy-coupling factor transporter ATP-binding protein EcfA2